MTLKSDLEKNYQTFKNDWTGELDLAVKALAKSETVLTNSYVRLSTIQAWRAELLENILPAPCLGFFLEAQNDALLSHVLAGIGSWRLALKALRSCLENVLLSMYYKDHPVELSLWETGKFRIGFSELIKYFEIHPLVNGLPASINPIPMLSTQYAELSRAVHASSISFRMTTDGKAIKFWDGKEIPLSKWATNERNVVVSLNLFLLALLKEHLSGTRQSNLRRSLALVIPTAKDAPIKTSHKVTIKR